MLTKDDLKAIAELIKTEGNLIRKDMATKSDLALVRQDMATKSDLTLVRQDMATKSDLLYMARKSDLKNMVTNKNLDIFAKIFKIELAAQKQEILEAMKDGFNELAKIIIKIKTKQDEQIEHLKKRVGKLENRHFS